MLKLTIALCGLILMTQPSLASAYDDAPFGLTWGMSIEEAKRQGIKLTANDGLSDGPLAQVFLASNLPKSPAIAETYALVFTNHGLQKVSMVSTDFESDVYGTDGKKAYSRIKMTLTKKYGKPADSTQLIGVKLYTDSDEFYQCLNYDGCGFWGSMYETGDGKQSVILRLKGSRRGEGYLTITYEGSRWSDSVRDREAAAKDVEEDAF